MSNKKKIDFISYFLKHSPASQYHQFTKIFIPNVFCNKPPPQICPDEKYLVNFLDDLEVFGISNTTISHHKSKRNWEQQPKFRRAFSSMYTVKKTTAGSCQEPQQLIESIKQVNTNPGEGTIPLQELEQRLQIASPQAISEVRTKLIYLFKILINKRDKIPPNSLMLDANIQLSRAIMDSLTRTQNDQHKENWRQLEAMEKLLRAREYHKKGLREIAINNFEQIFRDETASANTRLQALKVFCSSREKLGDPSILESLASEMQARGEKEYEEIIVTSIQRIKQMKG